MLASGDVFAGYVIERQLGRGGMGSVYLAKHPRLPRMTALKLLNREMFFDKEIRARFEREADLVAQLDHPNIVTVYDRGLEDDQLWISMQYIDGIDAGSVDPHTLPPERAVQIIKETADALDYAHGVGVLHRDVKPANVLLARSGGGRGERVYLTDFGIARLRDDTGHLTQTGTFTATLAYASPEQLTGATLDHRSDQYSLACSLFWLMTGNGPYQATNPAQVIQGHLQAPPPALSNHRPGLPYALDNVLAKAMAKRPDDRFANCTEFALAARQALGNRSAPAIPVVGPRPVTGPPIPNQQPPQTNQPHPAFGPQSSGSNPLVGQGAYPPPTLVAQPHSTSPYTNGPTNFQPPVHRPPQQFTPPPPPKKSNAGLIIAICIGVIVLLVLVLALIGALSDSSSNASDSGSSSTSSVAAQSTSGVKSSSGAADAKTISAQFSRMVPAGADDGVGFDSARCWNTDPSFKPSTFDGEPNYGSWAWQWICSGGNNNDDPLYRFVIYKSTDDLQSVLKGLPSGATKSTDTNGGKTYTNYKWTDSKSHQILTVFSGGDKDRILFVCHDYSSPEELLSWWKKAPL
ncbi:serine/threonine protein kinase [Nocardia arthritidis]|uniref:non-specific serine/threonine protein kinase n=1 Tax=Nocardia arthritidis TaxID=228602 RepID=A0A6G9YPR4_9NOCA|nr:serine/threonine-protein kinase [Nocardia arthritidis]QIS15289.1 protein kinase [Nocardia arthritidis]